MIKDYKNKEMEDKLFEQQILSHMANLDEDYEEFIHAGKILEQAKSDVTPGIEFSGVTDRLEDIKNNIELALGGEESRRKFFDE